MVTNNTWNSPTPIPNSQLANSSISVSTSGGVTASPSPVSLGGTLSLGTSNIPNASLQNSSITINAGSGISVSGSPVSLGGSCTITNSGASSLGGFYYGLTTPLSTTTGGGTVYKIIFDNLVYDPSGWYNTSTGNFTVPATGLYLFNLGCVFTGLSTANTTILYITNGLSTTIEWGSNINNLITSGGNWAVSLAGMLYLTAADVVTSSVIINGQGGGGIGIDSAIAHYSVARLI